MEKEFIVINGKKYRVEVNWNATTAFLKAIGRDTIEELSNISDFRPSELTALMAACIAEGERLEGRNEAPSAMDLGAVITTADVTNFLTIYVKMSAPRMAVEQKKEEREEQPAS